MIMIKIELFLYDLVKNRCLRRKWLVKLCKWCTYKIAAIQPQFNAYIGRGVIKSGYQKCYFFLDGPSKKN